MTRKRRRPCRKRLRASLPLSHATVLFGFPLQVSDRLRGLSLSTPPLCQRYPTSAYAAHQQVKAVIEEGCQEHQAEVLSLEIMPDHVHLLVECDPQFGIHRLVRLLKGRSSRILRQEFPELKKKLPTLWTHSYFVSTVGGASLSVIKHYIENQKHV